MSDRSLQYTVVSRLLHWVVAGLIVSQYVIARLAENADERGEVFQQLGLLANHKSIGMTVLALAFIRLAWRLFNSPPLLPGSMSAWQQRASHLAHWGLYALLFSLPLSGWLMSSASAFSVSWFNLFSFPDLVVASESLADYFHSLHHWLAEALFILALVHILAALKHHFFDKDDVLSRMASLGGYLILIVSIAISVGVFGRVSTIPNDAPKQDSSETATTESIEFTLSDLALWDIDYDNSFIKFSGEQAGAPFEGKWQQWAAKMQFSESALDKSGFDVEVQTHSSDSQDSDRDETIAGPEFFDAKNYAIARFTTQNITRSEGNEFNARAVLVIKGVAKPLDFVFSVTDDGAQKVLTGEAVIDRLAWNIGTGDWVDTTWVGQMITVEVNVVASVN